MSAASRPPRPSPPHADVAIRRLEKVHAAHPGDLAARYNLALALIERKRREEARRHLEAILAAEPRFAPAVFTLGHLAMDDGDLDRAERLLRAAAAAPALTLDSRTALAEALARRNRRDEAVATLNWVIAQSPPSPAPYVNLARMLMADAPSRALAAAETGIARFPRMPLLHVERGHALTELRRADEAVDALRLALDLAPGSAAATGYLLRALREAARWDEEGEAIARVRAALARAGKANELPISLHSALNFAFDGGELKEIARQNANRYATAPLPANDRPSGASPLVVGYLSPDYHDHATAHLAADLFSAHDPKRVRAVAFSLGPDDGDPVRTTIRDAARPFVDLRGLSDREAAERIRDEGTHILVDLSMFTRSHRPGIPALRPAPVQAAWLGLPSTTGAPWFDYLLADDIVAPPEHADRFTETLVHLPCGYQPNRRPFPITAVSRAEAGVPEGVTVLACFNAHLKIDEESFAAWVEILNGVPGSVLWLLAPPDAVAERYRARAAAAGIAPERLIFAPKLRRAAHLARIGCADLMLDCLVYGAHTTCSDALRAGVPMLTVLGKCFAARVGASLLSRAGVSESVLPNRDAFVAEAIRLGNDAGALAALREKLSRVVPASPVFDPDAQAHALENAYERMWEDHEKTASRDRAAVSS